MISRGQAFNQLDYCPHQIRMQADTGGDYKDVWEGDSHQAMTKP